MRISPVRSQSPSQPFFAMSRNSPSKETAAHIGTTILSRIEPITAKVPFSGTVSFDSISYTSRFINALDHHKYAGLLFVFFCGISPHFVSTGDVDGFICIRGQCFCHVVSIRKREDPGNENECVCGGHYSSRQLSFGECRLFFSVRLIYKVRRSRLPFWRLY